MADKHPRDDDQAKDHPVPHECVWVPVKNEWDEVIGYSCSCGAYQSA